MIDCKTKSMTTRTWFRSVRIACILKQATLCPMLLRLRIDTFFLKQIVYLFLRKTVSDTFLLYHSCEKIELIFLWGYLFFLWEKQHSLVKITYHLDNCSVVENGAVVEFHRDLYASANIFHWWIWSNTFANNTRGGFAVRLPDTIDLLYEKTHTFWVS